jgi:type 1 glutamine amidotransferase/nicotinamidase-related amidase
LSSLAACLPAGSVFAETITLDARLRITAADDPAGFEIVNNELKWETTKTAVIVCDMWDAHWCKGATARVGELVVPMNDFLTIARAKGMLIIHAPSGTVNYYANHPARKRATDAPKAANLPPDIDTWCNWISDSEKEAYPIDQSDGGCDCQPRCEGGSPWRKEIEGLTIGAEDAISDSGAEIWNLMEARGIDNVMLVGVHTNMCVLGRPFGLRNMARNGKNVLLARDLTDTMYNSGMAPKVSHFTGTDLIVEHIEKYVCPTIVSSEITGKDAFRFKDDKRKRLAFVIAENEYQSSRMIPEFARKMQVRYDFACDFCIGIAKATGPERHNIAGMGALRGADLAVIYVRRRALPAEQMKYLQDYLATGKGLIGIRTASHAFDAKGDAPAGLVEWKTFDPEVLGGNYHGHYGRNPEGTDVEIAASARSHPALTGVKAFNSPSWLYEVMPLAATTQVLMTGTIKGKPAEPVAWVNTYGNNRVFFTSLGHWDDWKIDSFDRLITNAVFWTMHMPIPERQ